jgi:hypothetical protein
MHNSAFRKTAQMRIHLPLRIENSTPDVLILIKSGT